MQFQNFFQVWLNTSISLQNVQAMLLLVGPLRSLGLDEFSIGFEILKLIGFKSPSVQPPTPHFDKFPTDCRQQKIQQTKMLVTQTQKNHLKQNEVLGGFQLVDGAQRSHDLLQIQAHSLVENLFVKKKSFTRFAFQSESCNFNQ